MTSQNQIQSKIEQRVMASVGAIYTARKIFAPTMLKVYILAGATLAIWRLVWVTRIEENFLHVMNGGLSAAGNYAVYSILHTHLVVQVMLAVAAVTFVMLVLDLVRSATPRLNLA